MTKRAQASLEFLMSYGWMFIIIVIAGAALYSAGIINPSTYRKTGCVGFEKMHYRDHQFRATGTTGIWDITVDNPDADDRDSSFKLRIQNGGGMSIRVRNVDVEYPEGVHVTWTERGYNCDYYNTGGDTTSGCLEQNVSEGEISTLSIEDVGAGMVDLHHGNGYRAKVKVTFDVFNAIGDHAETAICSGKIEGGQDPESISLIVSAGAVEEDAGTSTITARLSGHNDLDVHVVYTISGTAIDGTDYSLDAYEVTIPQGDLERNITVTSTHDRVDEDDETVIATIQSVSNIAYNQAGQSATVTITDDDSSSIVIDNSTPVVFEVPGQAQSTTYKVKMNSDPTDTVTVTLAETVDHHSELSITSSTTLIFTGGGGGNWDDYQTVSFSVVDDDYDEATGDGLHYGHITHTAASSDTLYDGQSRQINPEVYDEDVSGITLTESGGSTAVTEDGTTDTDTYTVVLDTKPYYDVVVTVTDDTEAYTDKSSLTFTDGDWDSTQTVTVTAFKDYIDETTDPHTGTVSHSVASTDSKYSGMSLSSVSVSITDDDSAGTSVPDTDTDVAEGQTGDGYYDILLTSEPVETVTITIVDFDEQYEAMSQLTFTSGNWNVSQQVTVTATDDDVDEAATHQHYIWNSFSSTDSKYSSGFVGVGVTITDDDTASMTLTESGGSTAVTEGGATDSYTVVLGSDPNTTVTVTIGNDADLQSMTALSFDSGDWDSTQIVTVTAEDDSDDETSPEISTITHTVTSSNSDYNGYALGSVSVSVTDDDVAAITLSLSGSPLAEDGGTATVSASANTEVAAEVTITLAFSGTATLSDDYTRSGTSLTISAGQTTSNSVTITGVNDDYDDDVETVIVDIDTVGPAANAAESGTQQVTATITDDEDASITVAESGGSTDVNEESATSDTYTIVLTSKPTDDVTIAISSADETEGATVDPSSVTFNPGAPNPWNTPQTVTVTAVDDGVVEVNPHTVLITNGAASSSDGDYNTLNPDDVTANISDND
ncbi:MAG: Calx-beta domain-containing protein [Candidatus Undinarchaeales archaeon]|nr:Calx-beta domain-containing protein [Candidatus Undinarchaeales archaeon]MDP7492963.1 Calx-beta domain-containing protein [Candidatus Undinarchaeales archaeon]